MKTQPQSTRAARAVGAVQLGIIMLAVAGLMALRPLAAQSVGDAAVGAKVRSELDRGFAAPGKLAVATRIQLALARVTNERDVPGKSTDPTLRDAEYYLHGLYGAAANDWVHIGPTLGAPVYNAIKWVAQRCKDAGRPELEEWLRTKPESPLSEPGGSLWAYRGLKDGWSIVGSAEVTARPAGHGLSLPALDHAAPCIPVGAVFHGTWKGSLKFTIQGSTFSHPAEITLATVATENRVGDLRVTNGTAVNRESLSQIKVSDSGTLSARSSGGATLVLTASADGSSLTGSLTDKNGVVGLLSLVRQ